MNGLMLGISIAVGQRELIGGVVPPPPTGDFILTENDDMIQTETTDELLITE